MKDTQGEMQILLAKPEDAADLARVHAASWQQAYRGIMPAEMLAGLSVEAKQQRIAAIIEEGRAEVYVCRIDGCVGGRIVIMPSRDEDRPKAGEVGAIYLLEPYWGRGYGRRLMDFGLARLRQLGYTEAILWVLEKNARARRFYEGYGFTPDGTRKFIKIWDDSYEELRYAMAL